MLKRFDTIVTQFDGTPWTDQKQQPLTVASAIVTALQGAFEDEKSLPPEEKFRRFLLAERIYNAGSTPTEVSIENLATIKACVGKMFNIGVLGFVFKALEGEGEK